MIKIMTKDKTAFIRKFKRIFGKLKIIIISTAGKYCVIGL